MGAYRPHHFPLSVTNKQKSVSVYHLFFVSLHRYFIQRTNV